MRRTIDPSVYVLAESWLSESEPGWQPDPIAHTAAWKSHEDKVGDLAWAIQNAITDWEHDEASDELAREEAHRTDEGDLGHLTIMGGSR